MNISSFKVILFDCDGVVLNSNHIKTEAFRTVTLPYGEHASDAFVKYHTDNGGVSRYRKFDTFVENILDTEFLEKNKINKERLKLGLLNDYSKLVRTQLMECEVASELNLVREHNADAMWFIVSGGDQNELREVFDRRGLTPLFDGGIYGSPLEKKDIIKMLHARACIAKPVLFFGDSRLDYEVAKSFDFDFCFVSQWTELKEWDAFCKKNEITAIKRLCDTIKGTE